MKFLSMLLALSNVLAMVACTTAESTSSSEVRHEFVRKMESAIANQDRDARVTTKLMEKAMPYVSEEGPPRFLEDYQDFAINITEYALKYIGCQNVHQYSSDMAEDEDASSVLGMSRFVVVRLCPIGSCSNYHHYGCTAGFGDYLIPMEDYLETMAEEYFAQYQEYCETCYYCMHEDANAQQAQGDDAAAQQYYAGDDASNNNNANNANGDDDANYNAAAGDDAYAATNGDDAGGNYNYYQNGYYGGGRRNLATTDDYYYMNADFYNSNDDYNGNNNNGNNNNGDNCANYYDACDSYRSACKDYSQFATNMEEFFQCGEFSVGDQVGYLGPHCRSDGKTIGVGLYKDQYCNEYNADMLDLSSMTGMDLGDENLKAYYSEQCISCLASDGYQLEQDQNQQVSPICGAVYDLAAKCNRYMGNDGDINSANQEDTEDTVCTFIHNLITNNYDEYGEIYLEAENWQAYIPDVQSMSKFQKYAISMAVLSVVGLLAYASYLHRVISQAKYSWYPKGRRGFSKRSGGGPGGAAPMERMHSGIIQGRSRSGKGMELLDGAVYA